MESAAAGAVLWILSLAAAAAAGAAGVVLARQWFAFGSSVKVSLAAIAAYASGCIALIVCLVALAAAV